MNCSCVLEIETLLVSLFANIFSIGCLFILFIIFFAVWEQSLIRSHLFIFAFVSVALGDLPKKILVYNIYIRKCSPVFSTGSFMNYCLIVKYLGHLRLFLCIGRGYVLINWLSVFPNTTYWRDCLFSFVYSYLFCQRLTDYRWYGFVSGLCYFPLICVSVFVPTPRHFDYFVVFSEVWENYASSFVPFTRDCFGSSASFMVLYEF